MSEWVNHVKAFSEKHKMKYNEAMKSKQCKDEYHKKKGKQPEMKDMVPKIRKPKTSKMDMKAV